MASRFPLFPEIVSLSPFVVAPWRTPPKLLVSELISKEPDNEEQPLDELTDDTITSLSADDIA